jgi:hypothetical protein
LCGKLPYYNLVYDVQVMSAIVAGETPIEPESYKYDAPKALWGICVQCWNMEPDERPKASQLLDVGDPHLSKFTGNVLTFATEHRTYYLAFCFTRPPPGVEERILPTFLCRVLSTVFATEHRRYYSAFCFTRPPPGVQEGNLPTFLCRALSTVFASEHRRYYPAFCFTRPPPGVQERNLPSFWCRALSTDPWR